MFTTNENTTGNMPSDESKIREHCYTATKNTQVFKDLLASGEVYHTGDTDSEEEAEEEGEEAEAAQEVEEEQLEHIKKYVKIQLDDIDIYTAVRIDGMKVKSDGSAEPCLIRSFIETTTDGGWIEDMKKTQGTLVFQEYLANSCSVQKWICEGRIAGVENIKMGFIGFEKQKPKIINVNETSLKSMESYISFKESECWPILKYVLDLLYSCDSGTYVLSRSPYTPLAIKLFNLPVKEEEPEEEA
jgi:hypothetical protein